MDYKQKALKYKLKYLNLLKQKNQHAGDYTEWYNKFEEELRYIYNEIHIVRSDVVLTGSAAISFILKSLNMTDELNSMMIPNDLDFIYAEKLNPVNRTSFGEENEFRRKQDSPIGSVTYLLQNPSPDKLIKSFDLSKVPKVKSSLINGIQVINVKELKEYYRDDLDTDKREIILKKISLIDKIIQKITEEHLLNEYGLDTNVTKRRLENPDEHVFNINSFRNRFQNLTNDNTRNRSDSFNELYIPKNNLFDDDDLF